MNIARFVFSHFFHYTKRPRLKDTGEKYLYKYRGEADVQSINYTIIERKYRNTALGEAAEYLYKYVQYNREKIQIQNYSGAEYNRDLDLSRP